MTEHSCPFDSDRDCNQHAAVEARIDALERCTETIKRQKADKDNIEPIVEYVPKLMTKKSFWSAIGIITTFMVFIGGASFGLIAAQDKKTAGLKDDVIESKIRAEHISGNIKSDLARIQALIKSQTKGIESIKRDVSEIKSRLRKIEQKVQP